METLPSQSEKDEINYEKTVRKKKSSKETRKILLNRNGENKSSGRASEQPGVVMEEVKKVVNSVKMSRKMKDAEKNPRSSSNLVKKKS